MPWLYLIFAVVLAALLGHLMRRGMHGKRLGFIDAYQFHPAIRSKLAAKHPQLSDGQLDLVFDGLRDYFHICNQAGKKSVAMPSQVVDDAWHEFILFTRAYQQFCRTGLGRYLHHTPAQAMASPTFAQDSIKRAWRLACAKDGIHPAGARVLPLLFAIDAELNIPNGFRYTPDCRNPNASNYGSGYCASHIGCSSGCAGDSGALPSDGGADGGFFAGLGDSDGGGCGGD
ncbi:hypothetical protein Tel_04745 [Candidatus Tenderia electrophaga]|jgi:hypothetical protein|uniref:Uncharacterized protein n=1 Tax=Candidatus Tenderia electrophaga TaxID=1748243 RepID=A0A0S2TBK4_9GAMM|nr:hypothetical protein Tel_04745 [Candidatus Tenderia electrophaga]